MKILFVASLHQPAPLGVMCLSSVLKCRGHEVQCVDGSITEIRRAFREKTYDVVAFSTPSMCFSRFLYLASQVKRESNAFICFGGPHPTYAPEDVAKAKCIDAFCRGEGEIAMVEMIRRLQDGESLYDVPNWWVREGDHWHKNDIQPLISDLDELPFPDRDLFKGKYPPNEFHQPAMASRGCPFSCTYCYVPVYAELYKGKGKRVRRRSVGSLMEELKQVKSMYPGSVIGFYDDILILPPMAWLEDFFATYKEKIGLPFHCNLRAELITEPIANMLKDAGCTLASLGLESGDVQIRKEVMGRRMSQRTFVRAVHLLKKCHVPFSLYNILAVPGSDIEAELHTLKINYLVQPVNPMAFFFKPFPNLPLTQKAIKEGYYNGDSNKLSSMAFYRPRSPLKFADRKYERQVTNLHHLFAILVAHPCLYSIRGLLISLPLSPLYYRIYQLRGLWIGFFGAFTRNGRPVRRITKTRRGLAWKSWWLRLKYAIKTLWE
ncbi:MAG: B12-binding domain-containing radical SAM protein [Candidatus Omnitrophica bacterium]|nr:B12-binding domain-containing radical SAM protein [Candidatus Omnitrophota bacterium]